MKEVSIASVNEFQNEIKNHFGRTDDYHKHIRLWFRGQHNSTYELSPGIYRHNFIDKSKSEKERLTKEQHLSQDFEILSSGLRQGDWSDSDMYFLQQHYAMPTRLLDWTTNPLAGLYFAADDYKNPNNDGVVYILDAYEFEIAKQVDDFHGIATSRHTYFIDNAINVIYEWKDPETFSDYIIPVRPNQIDVRIRNQNGCFTFHVPKRPTLTEVDNKTLLKIVIPKDKKKEIFDELALCGVDEFSIFGDLDNLAKRIKRGHNIL